MTIGQYTTASGIAGPTPIDTLNQLDSFVTGALGWTKIDEYTVSATDERRIWYSEGEVPGKYAPMYLLVFTGTTWITFAAYTSWDPVTHTGNDLCYDSTETRIHNQTAADDYVFCGNKDFIFASVRLDSNGSSYLGGGGYWDTFYTPEQDPYPMLVFGQNGNTDTFATTARVRSYAYDPEGFLEPVSTHSGANAVYVAEDRNYLTSIAAPNVRDNRHLMLKQDFYTQRSRTDGGIPGMLTHEQRGEIPGLYQFHGSYFIAHERVVASGISIGDGIAGNEVGQGDWIVFKGTAANTYAIGPVVDWEQHPNTIPNIELWLKAGAYHLDGGSVRGLVDLSVNTNHATQTAVAQQPLPISSEAIFNGEPVARFDGDDYLTGTLSVVTDYTLFVVADYVAGPSRRPLLHIRGDVSGDDTIFALDFNTTVSGSAQVTAQSDGSPLLIDTERYSGLASNTPYIVSAVVSGTTTTLYVNGDPTASSTIADTRISVAGNTELNYAIGATLNSAGSVDGVARHEGNIAEVIVYARDLTDEEHQSVVCYLGDKYGVTVSGTCM